LNLNSNYELKLKDKTENIKEIGKQKIRKTSPGSFPCVDPNSFSLQPLQPISPYHTRARRLPGRARVSNQLVCEPFRAIVDAWPHRKPLERAL
jgi:hypothetical protein